MSSQKNENGYDIWSSFYDEYPNPTVAIDDLVFPKAYRSIKHKSVLEIGCGTGRHTKRIINEGNIVTALDASSGMLQKAREKIKSDSLMFIKGDYMEIEVPNGPFDVVIMSLVLEHIQNLALFFKKTEKLIVPGGSLYFSEIHPSRTAKGIMAHFKKLDGDELHLSSFPHSESEIFDAAESNGFCIESVESILGNKALSELNDKWKRYIDVPMIQIWKMRATKR